MADRLPRIFAQGRQANRDGKSIAANPYAPITGALSYDAWMAGWAEEEGPAYVVAQKGGA